MGLQLLLTRADSNVKCDYDKKIGSQEYPDLGFIIGGKFSIFIYAAEAH